VIRKTTLTPYSQLAAVASESRLEVEVCELCLRSADPQSSWGLAQRFLDGLHQADPTSAELTLEGLRKDPSVYVYFRPTIPRNRDGGC
jgi:hypothetical protein